MKQGKMLDDPFPPKFSFLSIIKESLKLLRSHALLLLPLAIIFFLPIAGLQIVRQGILARLLKEISDHAAADHPCRVLKILIQFIAEVQAPVALFISVLWLIFQTSVIFSVACIYTNKLQVSSKKILATIWKLWKPILLTWLCCLAISFALMMGLITAIFVSSLVTVFLVNSEVSSIVVTPLLICIAMVIAIYCSIVFSLALTIPVIQPEVYGFSAIKEGVRLLKKGKKVATILKGLEAIVVVVIAWGVTMIFTARPLPPTATVIDLLLIMPVQLVSMLARGVFYFSLKDFCNEPVDMAALSENLDGLLGFGEYLELPSKDPEAQTK